ncbi:QcrA and Rieske domain-containing protein [Arcicella rigui]|uniref:Rieske (2Fe-2S) protein n=1 Tax=Arcicella rigui TaxID=797020 RepID=A0ABU5Q999_9BACT|nr:Rieske (2Fe-2S) protein [Arcicella rigui]MEA5139232.1 Rieske (2Fe-2S) protein [Arcicella rigui]
MLSEESISRKDFLKSLGLGGAALMAVLTSCSSSSEAVTPSSVSIDLTSNITSVGNYTYSGGIIVARIASGNTASSFVALSKACTHEGTTVIYQGNGVFYCSNHGATFSTTGAVTKGPATKSLTQYTVTVSGTTLTLS